MSDDVSIDINVGPALANLDRLTKAHDNAMRGVGASSKRAATDMEGAFAKKVKAVTSLDQQMAALVTRFFGVGGLIMGLRAVGRELTDNTPAIKNFQAAWGAMSDDMYASIGTKIAPAFDAMTGGLNRLSEGMRLLKEESMGIDWLGSAMSGRLKLEQRTKGPMTVGAVDVYAEAEKNRRAYEALLAKNTLQTIDPFAIVDAENDALLGGMKNRTLSKPTQTAGEAEEIRIAKHNAGEMEKLNRIIEQGKQDHVDRLMEIDRFEMDMLDRKMEHYNQVAAYSADAIGGMTSTLLGGLQALAQGQSVAFDKLIADFLTNMGIQMFATGVKDVALGVSRGFSSYGFDATAYGLVTSGGIAMGAGAAMLAGGLPLTFAAYQGGGGGGGSMGAGHVGGSSQGQQTIERHYTVNVTHIGDGDPSTGRALAKHLDAAMREVG